MPKFYHQYLEEVPSEFQQSENKVVQFSLPENDEELICIVNEYILKNHIIGKPWLYKGHTGIFKADDFFEFDFSQSAIGEMNRQFGENIQGSVHPCDVIEGGYDYIHSEDF